MTATRFNGGATRAEAPLLEVRSLVKAFGGIRALDGVSLSIYPGEVLGIIGPNGSGKTTFVNVVTGLLPPTSGVIRFRGQPLDSKPWVAATVGIGRTFQTPRIFRNLTVWENVLTVAWSRLGRRESAELRTREILETLDLVQVATERPISLTLEQQKVLGIAIALALDPVLIFLDEPLAGLSPSELELFAERIRRLNRLGITIVYIEHIMGMVRRLCSRVVVFNHGKIIAEGPPDEVLRNPVVVGAYLGGETA